MPPRSETKRSRIERWLSERRPELIDAAAVGEMKVELAPVSDSYLRNLLRNSGYPMTPDVEGVNTRTLVDLERTLLALAGLYEAGRHDMRPFVISAKDRLRWAMTRSPDQEKRAIRDEMILWMLTWLENPGTFPLWVHLRRKALKE